MVRKYFDKRKKKKAVINTLWDNHHKLIFEYLSGIAAKVKKKIKNNAEQWLVAVPRNNNNKNKRHLDQNLFV